MSEAERIVDIALKPLRLSPGCVPAYDEARENLVKLVDSLVESAYAEGVAGERERLLPLLIDVVDVARQIPALQSGSWEQARFAGVTLCIENALAAIRAGGDE